MALTEELERIAAAATAFAAPEEALAGVIAAEPAFRGRVFLCSFEHDGRRSWIVLDERGEPVASRAYVREAVSVAALCEVAEETAGGGRLDELREELVRLRLTEAPEGIEEAEAAALELQRVLDPPPRVATAAYLDRIGAATRRLESALGETGASPFAAAMEQSLPVVEELAAEVESEYKIQLR